MLDDIREAIIVFISNLNSKLNTDASKYIIKRVMGKQYI